MPQSFGTLVATVTTYFFRLTSWRHGALVCMKFGSGYVQAGIVSNCIRVECRLNEKPGGLHLGYTDAGTKHENLDQNLGGCIRNALDTVGSELEWRDQLSVRRQ